MSTWATSRMAARLPVRLGPETPAGEVRAFAEGAELLPHHALLHELGAGEGAEAAIHAGEDPGPVPHRLRGRDDPVRDHLRMLHDVGGRVDDAGQEQHAV